MNASAQRLPHTTIMSLGRWLALAILAVAAIPAYLNILSAKASLTNRGDAFTAPGLVISVIAVIATALIFYTRPTQTRWMRLLELSLIVGAGLVFRAIFIASPPMLSHDAYRYVWDAHLVSHGVSPYTHIVIDPMLRALRDSAIWPLINWRASPTIYPPAAQLFFLLVNAISPLNIVAMKIAIELCDLGVGALTMLLLRQYGLDQRRAIIYWWSPIPILEFAYSAHIDALAILLTVAALALAAQRWRGAHTVAGAILGLAVLTKLYPLLFVIALARRRDRGFFIGLGAALLLTPLPFIPLGLGSGGFLSTYFSQRFVDQGILFRLITTFFVNARIQFVLQGMTLLALCAWVMWRRQYRQLQPSAAILALSAAWIAISPHLFPWYVASLLPFLALSMRLPELRSPFSLAHTLASASMPSSALWLFTILMPFTYVIFAQGHDANLFLWFFIVPAAVAIAPTLFQRLRKNHASATNQTSQAIETALPRLSESTALTIEE